jgi:chitin disaccharide deacetylase
MTRDLVVTADDFGLTDGVNRAVLRGHRDGIVTSTSLLAVGRAYAGAVELAKQAPGLSVGVHLAIVGEDPPLLPAAEVPSLVDHTGHFPLSHTAVLRRAVLGRLDTADVRREFRAQIERVLGDGLPVSHLDTHQHLHLWPTIGAVVVDLADEFGIPAVRLPRSARRTPIGIAVNTLAAPLRRRLDSAGLVHGADFAGLDEAGALDRALPSALARLARRGRSTVELNAHPGEPGDPALARFCWGYRWEHELATLTDPATAAQVDRSGFRLVSWADLAPRTQGVA